MTSKRGYTKREWDAINAYNDVTMKRLREEIRESISTGVWNHGLWVSLHIWGIRAATDNDVNFIKKAISYFKVIRPPHEPGVTFIKLQTGTESEELKKDNLERELEDLMNSISN